MESKNQLLLIPLCLAVLALAFASIDDPARTVPPIDAAFATTFGGTPPAGTPEGVVMDLPAALRQPNWGGGSCVHASTVSLLRWQGHAEMAAWWRSQYSGGETADRLIKRMDAAGLRYAYTAQGDIRFLEWACRTGRGAGLFYKPNHAINLVGLDDRYAYLLDNNDIHRPERHGVWERVPRAEFEERWRGYGGFAWTLVYTPPPPVPRLSP